MPNWVLYGHLAQLKDFLIRTSKVLLHINMNRSAEPVGCHSTQEYETFICINYTIKAYSLKSWWAWKISSAIPISLRSPTASSTASNTSSLCTEQINTIDNLDYMNPIPPKPNRFPKNLKIEENKYCDIHEKNSLC